MPDHAVVIRAVSGDNPRNYLCRDVHVDERFTVFEGFTYGCVDYTDGVALTESDDPEGTPFFEFPRDAVSFICEACGNGNHDWCRRGPWCDCQHRQGRAL